MKIKFECRHNVPIHSKYVPVGAKSLYDKLKIKLGGKKNRFKCEFVSDEKRIFSHVFFSPFFEMNDQIYK